MFQFEADIVSRKRISKSTMLSGLVSIMLLGYGIVSALTYGFVPILEKIVSQIGFYQYMPWIYLGFATLLVWFITRALRDIFRKKTVIGGKVSFDEKELKIVKGKDKYVIPESELKELNFDLKALPVEGDKKNKDQLFGGSWMRIPTQKDEFRCELKIESPRQKEELMNMIEFLKIEHDVKVKVNEVK